MQIKQSNSPLWVMDQSVRFTDAGSSGGNTGRGATFCKKFLFPGKVPLVTKLWTTAGNSRIGGAVADHGADGQWQLTLEKADCQLQQLAQQESRCLESLSN